MGRPDGRRVRIIGGSGCTLSLSPYETGNNFWKWRSTRFYKEFRAFFDKPAIMRQMVVLKWAGHTMLVHPNLKKKLSRMYYGEMSKGRRSPKFFCSPQG